MAGSRAPFWRRHRWLAILAGVAVTVVLVVGAALAVIAHHFQPFLRAALVDGLRKKFQTHVELDNFHVALGNGLEGEWGIWATGKGLRIWPPQPTADAAAPVAPESVPLITLDQFRFHVPLRYQAGKPVTISRVLLAGLKIVVPPRSQPHGAANDSASGSQKPSPASGSEPAPANKSTAPQPADPAAAQSIAQSRAQSPAQSTAAGVLSNVVVKRIECENAELILQTNKPDKLPLGFQIAHLHLTDVTAHGTMGFNAEMTNPKPKGVIHTTGGLGPWLTTDPGETPVSGSYTFDHADLATFRGIAGTLASTGKYQGTLRDIIVDGQADVPDFRLPQFGNAVALHTQFHAKVDGTNGDTWLDPVDATLGHSHFTTRGDVVRVKPASLQAAQPVTSANLPPLADVGHNIDLKVNVDRGHIEDFLRLATRSQTPILTGTLVVNASLHIPPGPEPAHERLRLDGSFKLDDARFSNEKVQNRILDLSLRGLGRPGDVKNTDANSVSSEMEGDFHMANAVISLPEIHYNVPGAAIELQGKYPLEGFMHFDGTARMQATVSQMVGGWKGFLLKPADRFFKKDGAGTVVPILIRGPHDAPEFSVDFGRMKKTSPETPGQKQ